MRSHRLWYLVLLVIVFLFNLFFSQYLSYCALWLTLILPFPFLPLLWYTRRHIAVQMDAYGPSAQRGSEIPFWITITNTSRLPLACGKLLLTFDNPRTGEHFEKVLPFSVAARSTSRIQWSAVSRHCGCVSVRVKRAKLLDLLGLFALPLRARPELCLLSMPCVASLPGNGPGRSAEDPECCQFSKEKPGSDPSETFGIREYQPGDSPRSVHWKLSTKLDRLMVRQFSQPASHSTLLLLEQAGPDPLLLDTLLDAYASLSAYFLAKSVAFTSMWYDSRSGQLQSREVANDQEAALQLTDALCAQPYAGEPFALQAFTHLPPRPYSRVLYLTTQVSQKELITLCDSGLSSQVTVLYCCQEDVPPQKEEARQAGVLLHPLHPGRLSDELLTLEL